MIHGKCNCGKKATSEFIVMSKKSAHSIKCCASCRPKQDHTKTKKATIQIIAGK